MTPTPHEPPLSEEELEKARAREARYREALDRNDIAQALSEETPET